MWINLKGTFIYPLNTLNTKFVPPLNKMLQKSYDRDKFRKMLTQHQLSERKGEQVQVWKKSQAFTFKLTFRRNE